MQRTRNHVSLRPANAASPCRPVVRKTRRPSPGWLRPPRRVADPVPVVVGVLRPARALEPEQAAPRRPSRPSRPTPRCAARTDAWRRRPRRCRCSESQPRARRGRRSRPRAPRPPGSRGRSTRPASDEMTRMPSRRAPRPDRGPRTCPRARAPSRHGRALARRRVEVAVAKPARRQRAPDHDTAVRSTPASRTAPAIVSSVPVSTTSSGQLARATTAAGQSAP